MMIQDTLTQYGGNFARPTKFNVKINPPKSTAGPIIDVLCKSVSLPEITQEPIELTFKGHKITVPGRTNQSQTITMTFYLDERYNLRKIFEEWIGLTDEHYYAGNGQRDVSDKFGNMILETVDYSEQSVTGAYVFDNIYPTSVGEVEFSAVDRDSIQEITITFSYYKMEEK